MTSEQLQPSRGRTSRPTTPRSLRSQQRQRSKSPPLDMFEHKKQRLEPYPVPEMTTVQRPSYELAPLEPAYVSKTKNARQTNDAPPITYPTRNPSSASKKYLNPWDEEEALKWPVNQPDIANEQNKRRMKYAIIAGIIITVITVAIVAPLVYVNNNGPRHNSNVEVPGA